MSTFLVILIIIVFVGVVFLIRSLMRKGIDAASKAANQKIFYKTEYEEGQQIVSKPLIFKTSASASEIMHELATHVSTVQISELPVGFKAAVYKTSSNSNRITYSFGNKLVPKTFDAEVVLIALDPQTTKGFFRILNWTEREGLIMGQDAMKKLIKEVQGAFSAADANKMIKGGLQNG